MRPDFSRSTSQNLFSEAVYLAQDVPAYRNNQFIEALPPILENPEIIDRMQRLLFVSPEERAAPSHVRMHLIQDIEGNFLQPLTVHVNLFSDISILIRKGYVKRNPKNADFLATLAEGHQAVRGSQPPPQQTLGPGAGLTLIGMSGVGKSTSVEAVLRCYPQVISHPQLQGPLQYVLQLCWLKLSCPPDGSIKGLCLQFFAEVDRLLGTNYQELHVRSHATVEKLRVAMTQVAFVHGLGLLIIDEVQNLSEAKSGGDRLMMNFFKLLRDVMRVPLVTIGTKAAESILGGNFQNARRHAGFPVFDRMKLDEEFELFCESLFDGQYLQEPIKADREMCSLLHLLSQGITDVVVKLFIQAQSRALTTHVEKLSCELIKQVYVDSFELLHPFLEVMRQGQEVDERRFDRLMLDRQLQAMAAPNYLPPEPKQHVASVAAAPPRAPQKTATAPERPPGVKRRIVKRQKDASACVLVGVVANALKSEQPPHRALLEAGFVRRLGAEALAV